MLRKRPWLRRGLLVLLLLVLLSQGLFLLANRSAARGFLAVRLAAAFGRPVEVGSFDVAVFSGPALIARYVTVAEDPRFGAEHFLRAEQVRAGLRWTALLAGRLEFDSFSFRRPSLNIVRGPDGVWNLESWLAARPPATASACPPDQPVRFARVDVDAGRVNFKRGLEKHPIAFVNVEGSLTAEGAGRWRVDLQARPMRVGVVLQEAGLLRLRGRLGGSSYGEGVLPADLALEWREVSLADLLRLSLGRDLGVRGGLDAALRARSEGTRWLFAGQARVHQVHRWDLPPRPADPALHLAVEAAWWPQEARVVLTQTVLEAPGSRIETRGTVRWSPRPDVQLRLASSGLAWNDLFDWLRAFRPGVAEGARLEGHAQLTLELRDWPVRVVQASLTSPGVTLHSRLLPGAVACGPVAVRWQLAPAARFELLPMTLDLPGRRAAFRVQGWTQLGHGGPPPRGSGELQGPWTDARRGLGAGGWPFALALVGDIQRLEDLQTLTAVMGWPVLPAWDTQGSARLDVEWRGHLHPFRAWPAGTIELRDARLRPPFLAEFIELAPARVELGQAAHGLQVHVLFTSARAFGARWSGAASKAAPDAPWAFELRGDRLSFAELGAWFGVRARPGLLERLLPAFGRRVAAPAAPAGAIRAGGRIQLAELTLPGLRFERLDGRLELEGPSPWRATLSHAGAAFSGGAARGSLHADFTAEPAYEIQAEVKDVDVAALVAASPSLRARLAGRAAGEVVLRTRGAGRDALLRALEGQGSVTVRAGQYHALDLRESLQAGRLRPGTTVFRSLSGTFRLGGSSVLVEKLLAEDDRWRYEGTGTISFTRALDLRVERVAAATSRPAGPLIRLTGSLEAPVVTPARASPRR